MTAISRLIDAHASIQPPRGDQRARALARLDDAIDAERHQPTRLRRQAVVALVATGLLAVVALAGPWHSHGDRIPGGPQAAVAASCNRASKPASACLHAFAALARAQVPVNHGLVYWEHEIDYGSVGQRITPETARAAGVPAGAIKRPFFVNRKAEVEIFITPAKHVYATARGVAAVFPTPADRAAWKADGSPSLDAWLRTSPATSPTARNITARSFYILSGGPISTLDIEHLPPTASELLRALRHVVALELPGTPGSASCAEQRPSCPVKTRGIMNRLVLEHLLSLLRYPFTTPASRGTIFEALSQLHGAELLGRISDPEGRPGIGILLAHNPDENLLVFQPQTGQLLATGLLANPNRNSINQTHWWNAYLLKTGSAQRIPAEIKRAPPYCCS